MTGANRWIGAVGMVAIGAVVAAHHVGPAQAMKIRPLQDRVIVKVVDTEDPEGMGRIKVAFPWLPDDSASPIRFRTEWAPVVVPLTASATEPFVLPQVDDEVLVGFLERDPMQPVILGRLWDGRTPPGVPDSR